MEGRILLLVFFIISFVSLCTSDTCSLDADTIISSNCDIAAGTYTYNSFVVSPGVVVSIYSNLSSENAPGVTIVADTFQLTSGSIINGFGNGFGPFSGPGAPTSTNWYQAAVGAGHSGDGGSTQSIQLVGLAYGSFEQPIHIGSGGGSTASDNGGAGGGAIHIIARQVVIDGMIDVSGKNGGNSIWPSGGGSGGSIWIQSSLFSGSGTIRSNGGDGGNSVICGGGSAGRISIEFDTNQFLGSYEAHSGLGYMSGGRGTMYFFDKTQQIKSIRVDNGVDNVGKPAVITDIGTTRIYQFDNIDLRNSGDLLFADIEDSLIVTSSQLSGDSTSMLCTGGYLDASSISSIQQVGFCTVTTGTLKMASDITMSDITFKMEGTLEGVDSITSINSAIKLSSFGQTSGNIREFKFAGDISLEYTVLEVIPDYIDSLGASLSCNNFRIAASSIVGPGHPSNSGPGYGQNNWYNSAPGAGSSGDGGNGNAGMPPGLAYGSLKKPVNLGSGGGSTASDQGGIGGSAIKISAQNELFIDDSIIDVSGRDGTCNIWCAGGGSGGSIWLEATTLKGIGSIKANGGRGGNVAGGGSAGRIALYYSFNQFSGSIESHSGAGWDHGGVGTIYMNDKSNDYEILRTDNLNIKAKPGVVTSPNISEIYHFDIIDLTQAGDIQFRDTDDTVIIYEENMLGDSSSI